MSPIFKSSTSTLLSPNWCLPPPSTLYPSSVSLLTDVNQNLMSDVPWRDVSRHQIKVKSELHSVSSRSRELRPTLIFIIIKLLLIKKTKKPKKRGKPHSIEIKLLTNIWCSEVNMHINNLISILQFSRLGKSGERPFLWLQFSVQQPAPTSRTFHISTQAWLWFPQDSVLPHPLPLCQQNHGVLWQGCTWGWWPDDCDVCLLPPAHPTPKPS